MKLTPKQMKFCDEYIISGNTTQSAIKAGYSLKTAGPIGSENLTKPNIHNYISERLKLLDSEKIADQKEIREYLTSMMRGEIKEEVVINPIVGNGKMEPKTMNKQASAKDRTKAAELLGKTSGLFSDKLEVNTVAQVVFAGEEDLEE